MNTIKCYVLSMIIGTTFIAAPVRAEPTILYNFAYLFSGLAGSYSGHHYTLDLIKKHGNRYPYLPLLLFGGSASIIATYYPTLVNDSFVINSIRSYLMGACLGTFIASGLDITRALAVRRLYDDDDDDDDDDY